MNRKLYCFTLKIKLYFFREHELLHVHAYCHSENTENTSKTKHRYLIYL